MEYGGGEQKGVDSINGRKKITEPLEANLVGVRTVSYKVWLEHIPTLHDLHE